MTAMSLRAAFFFLGFAVCTALHSFAEDSGAIRTTITNTTTIPIEATPKPASAPSASPSQIWCGLVFATNSTTPKPTPSVLREFVARSARIYGYNQYELVGSATQEVGAGTESWLVPSKSFFLSLKGRRAVSKEAQGGFLLDVELFQEKRSLLQAEVKLAPGSPISFRGPQYGKGQLIIVLQVER
jgi:hypothetical protein